MTSCPTEVWYFPNPVAVYAKNEISLLDTKLYDLDYDYTGLVHSHTAPQDFQSTYDILIEYFKYAQRSWLGQ